MLDNKTIILAGASFLSMLMMGLWWKKRRSLDHSLAHVRWRKVGEVGELVIYPLKGGKGVPLKSAKCAPMGLVDFENPHLQLGDRQLIVYNPDQLTAVTALTRPQLVLMEAIADTRATVRLSYPGRPGIHFNLPQADRDKVVLLNRWWGERVGTMDCGDTVAQWMSETLTDQPSGLRLGYYSTAVPRRQVANGWVKFAQVYSRFCSEYLGAYSYMGSYLLINEESVRDLEREVGWSVDRRRFRANLSVRACDTPLPAYCEDHWDYVRLGDSAILQGFKPCTRCSYTCIDPNTGRRNSNMEPLKTLKRCRPLTTDEERKLSGDEPVFGLYAGLVVPGVVRVGDPVYIGVM